MCARLGRGAATKKHKKRKKQGATVAKTCKGKSRDQTKKTKGRGGSQVFGCGLGGVRRKKSEP